MNESEVEHKMEYKYCTPQEITEIVTLLSRKPRHIFKQRDEQIMNRCPEKGVSRNVLLAHFSETFVCIPCCASRRN